MARLFVAVCILVLCVASSRVLSQETAEEDGDDMIFAECRLGEYGTAGGLVVFAQRSSGGETVIAGRLEI